MGDSFNFRGAFETKAVMRSRQRNINIKKTIEMKVALFTLLSLLSLLTLLTMLSLLLLRSVQSGIIYAYMPEYIATSLER